MWCDVMCELWTQKLHWSNCPWCHSESDRRLKRWHKQDWVTCEIGHRASPNRAPPTSKIGHHCNPINLTKRVWNFFKKNCGKCAKKFFSSHLQQTNFWQKNLFRPFVKPILQVCARHAEADRNEQHRDRHQKKPTKFSQTTVYWESGLVRGPFGFLSREICGTS